MHTSHFQRQAMFRWPLFVIFLYFHGAIRLFSYAGTSEWDMSHISREADNSSSYVGIFWYEKTLCEFVLECKMRCPIKPCSNYS